MKAKRDGYTEVKNQVRPIMSRKRQNNNLTVLSLFTGAGGFDLGLEAAGFQVIGAVEADHDCRRTLTLNRPEWPVAKKHDIHSYSAIELAKEFALSPKKLTLLSAGPPCQPFSKSGYWKHGDSKRMADPRAKTLHALFDIIEHLLPRVVLIENVGGIAFTNKDQGLKYILRRFKGINSSKRTRYQPKIFKLNAAEYGVPQIRERVFIIAIRDAIDFVLPSPTHHLEAKPGEKTLPAITCGEAIGKMSPAAGTQPLKVGGRWANLLPSIPEGKNYLWHTEKGGGKRVFRWRSRYWSFLLKLSRDKPSWTIQASPGCATGPFHWDNRKLSIEEAATLQTFPPNYKFESSYTSSFKQIGNAVPSAIGELFGRAIRKQVLGENISIKLSLIPKRQLHNNHNRRKTSSKRRLNHGRASPK